MASLTALMQRYGLDLCMQAENEAITGSFWGDEEAGIIGRSVYARPDTPVHSLLEEAAVCYLQLVLADELEGVGRQRLMCDMDAWGYSFRLGNTARWFAEDAVDARTWLIRNGLLNQEDRPIFRLRE